MSLQFVWDEVGFNRFQKPWHQYTHDCSKHMAYNMASEFPSLCVSRLVVCDCYTGGALLRSFVLFSVGRPHSRVWDWSCAIQSEEPMSKSLCSRRCFWHTTLPFCRSLMPHTMPEKECHNDDRWWDTDANALRFRAVSQSVHIASRDDLMTLGQSWWWPPHFETWTI